MFSYNFLLLGFNLCCSLQKFVIMLDLCQNGEEAGCSAKKAIPAHVATRDPAFPGGHSPTWRAAHPKQLFQPKLLQLGGAETSSQQSFIGCVRNVCVQRTVGVGKLVENPFC